ncbi:MAG: hypothetical protein GY847_00430 [Proteobacteria bacterium]|nr:hypothetical protein [Pseudomonadota bacterium]
MPNEEWISVDYDISKGYPVDKSLYYECQVCMERILSFPEENTGCKCQNIFVDVDSARVIVENETAFKIVTPISTKV